MYWHSIEVLLKVVYLTPMVYITRRLHPYSKFGWGNRSKSLNPAHRVNYSFYYSLNRSRVIAYFLTTPLNFYLIASITVKMLWTWRRPVLNVNSKLLSPTLVEIQYSSTPFFSAWSFWVTGLAVDRFNNNDNFTFLWIAVHADCPVCDYSAWAVNFYSCKPFQVFYLAFFNVQPLQFIRQNGIAV